MGEVKFLFHLLYGEKGWRSLGLQLNDFVCGLIEELFGVGELMTVLFFYLALLLYVDLFHFPDVVTDPLVFFAISPLFWWLPIVSVG
jgi:hypothetical protein